MTSPTNRGFAAAAPLAFWLNGEVNGGSSLDNLDLFNGSVSLQGMIILNTTAQTAMNVSAEGFSGYQPRTSGAMVYIPDLGSSEILVAFGGTWSYANENTTGSSQNYESLSQTFVFDIATHYGWYGQATTGDVPQPRIDFCAVAISASDGSSHKGCFTMIFTSPLFHHSPGPKYSRDIRHVTAIHAMW